MHVQRNQKLWNKLKYESVVFFTKRGKSRRQFKSTANSLPSWIN